MNGQNRCRSISRLLALFLDDSFAELHVVVLNATTASLLQLRYRSCLLVYVRFSRIH